MAAAGAAGESGRNSWGQRPTAVQSLSLEREEIKTWGQREGP